MTDKINDLESDFDNLSWNLILILNNLSARLDNLNQTIVVGLWDGLDENLDYPPQSTQWNWLYEFEDNKLMNPEYISVSNTNTRITLLKPGWYRIHLSVMWYDIEANTGYYTRLLKNGTSEFAFDSLVTGATVASIYYGFDGFAFVYSDGSNYIEVHSFASHTDSFYIAIDDYNQFMIEYLAI